MESVFDIIGPIMIGPSSSHTAGALKLARRAMAIFGGTYKDIKHITIKMHGSFGKTHEGHHSDEAIIAGIMGMDTNDKRIPKALEIAKKEKLKFKFERSNLGKVHPNTLRFLIQGKKKRVSILGSSIGGGIIRIIKRKVYKS